MDTRGSGILRYKQRSKEKCECSKLKDFMEKKRDEGLSDEAIEQLVKPVYRQFQ